ncbi:MAG: D-alanyl-D-alanine carboxypeptidase, partial [Tritonibacter mobilis]|nr:D-alanyl-D-alanine carboxypeptidase [Tritonibacter mobilis]
DGRAPSNTRNRNPLLQLDIGADGLKTGHTQEAGYGLVGSAKQGDRRVIFVISGMNSTPERAEESEAIVNWAFRQFTKKTIAREGIAIEQAEVWMGDSPTVGLVPAENLEILLPALSGDAIKAEVVYTGPVTAPIQAGQQLAELVVKPEDLPEMRLPLVAQSDVGTGGFPVKVMTAARVLVKRFLNGPEDAT